MSNKAIDGFTVLGNFAGKRVELSSYQEEYSEFEVIAKIYNWGVSCVLGLVMEEWQSIMGICFGGGDMVYVEAKYERFRFCYLLCILART